MDRNRRKRKIPILVFAVLAFVGASPAAPAPKPTDTAPGEILVGYRDGVSTAEQSKVLAKVGATEKRKFTKIHGALLDVKPEKVERALEQLRADDRVRYAEPNTPDPSRRSAERPVLQPPLGTQQHGPDSSGH